MSAVDARFSAECYISLLSRLFIPLLSRSFLTTRCCLRKSLLFIIWFIILVLNKNILSLPFYLYSSIIAYIWEIELNHEIKNMFSFLSMHLNLYRKIIRGASPEIRK